VIVSVTRACRRPSHHVATTGWKRVPSWFAGRSRVADACPTISPIVRQRRTRKTMGPGLHFRVWSDGFYKSHDLWGQCRTQQDRKLLWATSRRGGIRRQGDGDGAKGTQAWRCDELIAAFGGFCPPKLVECLCHVLLFGFVRESRACLRRGAKLEMSRLYAV